MAIRGSYLDVQGGPGRSAYAYMVGRVPERTQSAYLDRIREQDERHRRRFEAIDERHRRRFEAIDERHRRRFEAIDERHRRRFETLSGHALESRTRYGSVLAVESVQGRYTTLAQGVFDSRTRYGSVGSSRLRYQSPLSRVFEGYESPLSRAFEPIRAYESLLGRTFEQYRGYESRLGWIFAQDGAGYESALRIVEQIRWDIYEDADADWLGEDDGETWWFTRLSTPALLLLVFGVVLPVVDKASEFVADLSGEDVPPEYRSGAQLLIVLALAVLTVIDARAKVLAADEERRGCAARSPRG